MKKKERKEESSMISEKEELQEKRNKQEHKWALEGNDELWDELETDEEKQRGW